MPSTPPKTRSLIAARLEPRSAGEVLLVFLRLGCLSFGGPVAHLGYFHAEFVDRRRWLTSDGFAELVAIAQSLPGPASSQVAFAIGLLRARWLGSLAAWTGFTLPSALLLFAFASSRSYFAGALGDSVLHGLQLVAVAIVAQAVWTMQRALAPDPPRLAIAIAAAALVSFAASPFTTIATLAAAALLGGFGGLLRGTLPHDGAANQQPPSATLDIPFSRAQGLIAAAIFLVLLLLLPTLAAFTGAPALVHFNAFYRAGALVFGGGHVVLPLLEQAVVVPGWVDERSFLAGYGMAQAVPGPLFTFAGYLGAVLKDPNTNAPPISLAARGANSALALGAIFLPGLLLMIAALPFWVSAARNPRLRGALGAVNASVVGILFAALLRPVATTAFDASIHYPRRFVFDAALVAAAFYALTRLKAPPIAVVAAAVACSVIAALLAGNV